MQKREFLIGSAIMALSAAAGGTVMAASVEPVDMAALAALRPGMPMAAVEKAMGSLWRAPAPHKGGVIDILENSHGVVVRLDRHGAIGRIDFTSRFEQTIAGIPMGIPLEALPAAVPELKIGEESKVLKGRRMATMQLPEGLLLAQVSFDKVYDISIFNPNADYAEPTAPPYPAPSGEPGAPFSDPNLKLAVMSSLLRSKALDLGTEEQLASHVLGRPVDLEEDGYELMPEALDYLVRYPLSEEQLSSVEFIELDGGGDIYSYAWYFWTGEENTFDVKDLSGLSFCPNLKVFSVISMIDEVDLRALVPLKKLEELSINVPSRNIEALVELPSLKKAYSFPATSTTQGVLETLKKRGVTVGQWQ